MRVHAGEESRGAEATLVYLAALTAMSKAVAEQPSLLARFGPRNAIALECECNLPGARGHRSGGREIGASGLT
jgi:hypothetical protein